MLYNFINKITLKKVYVFFSIVAFLLIANYLLHFSVITIKNDNKHEIKAVVTSNQGKTNEYSIKEGGKKTVFLRSGSHTVRTLHQDKESITRFSTNWIKIKEISHSLENQKSTTALGESDRFSCVYERSEIETIYLPCNIESLLIPVKTTDGRFFEPLYGKPLLEGSSSHIYLPYMDKIMQINKESEVITGTIMTNDDTAMLKDFMSIDISSEDQQDIRNWSFATDSNDQTNPRFVALIKGKLYLFKDTDSPPTTIDISDKIIQSLGYTSKIILKENTLYIFNGINTDLLVGDSPIDEAQNVGQNIFRLNLDTGEIEETTKIDKDLYIKDMDFSSDQASVIASKNISDYAHYVLNNGDLEESSYPRSSNINTCSTKSDSYFVYDGGLYKNKSKEDHSNLLLKTEKPISNINCINDSIYVSLLDENTNKYIFYKINNTDQNGNRIENILPISGLVSPGINYARLYKNNLYVEMADTELYENRNVLNYVSSGQYFEKDKELVANYLLSIGIPVNSYNSTFEYEDPYAD